MANKKNKKEKVTKATEITEMHVSHISFVKEPANKIPFLLTKSADDGDKVRKVKYIKPIIKSATDEKRLIYGVVYEPTNKEDIVLKSLDHHNEFMTAEAIEAMAHRYMMQSQRTDVEHSFETEKDVRIVESYITKSAVTIGEREVKEGSWVIVAKAISDTIWNGVQNGDYTGFSLAGLGLLQEYDLDEEGKLITKSKETDEAIPEVKPEDEAIMITKSQREEFKRTFSQELEANNSSVGRLLDILWDLLWNVSYSEMSEEDKTAKRKELVADFSKEVQAMKIVTKSAETQEEETAEENTSEETTEDTPDEPENTPEEENASEETTDTTNVQKSAEIILKSVKDLGARIEEVEKSKQEIIELKERLVSIEKSILDGAPSIKESINKSKKSYSKEEIGIF